MLRTPRYTEDLDRHGGSTLCGSIICRRWHVTTGWWLTYPSEKWWTSSVGMIKIPTKNGKVMTNSMVPNHQPDKIDQKQDRSPKGPGLDLSPHQFCALSCFIYRIVRVAEFSQPVNQSKNFLHAGRDHGQVSISSTFFSCFRMAWSRFHRVAIKSSSPCDRKLPLDVIFMDPRWFH